MNNIVSRTQLIWLLINWNQFKVREINYRMKYKSLGLLLKMSGVKKWMLCLQIKVMNIFLIEWKKIKSDVKSKETNYKNNLNCYKNHTKNSEIKITNSSNLVISVLLDLKKLNNKFKNSNYSEIQLSMEWVELLIKKKSLKRKNSKENKKVIWSKKWQLEIFKMQILSDLKSF